MSNGAGITDSQQLSRIAREGAQPVGEVSVVASPGARAAAWAVKIKSNSSYNVYNVVAAEIGDCGDGAYRDRPANAGSKFSRIIYRAGDTLGGDIRGDVQSG
jgi:hypothetical protein